MDLCEKVFFERLLPIPAYRLFVGGWNAMISAYGKHGRGKDALSLFHRMLHEGIPSPTDVTLISILSACSHNGLVEEALHIYHSMLHQHQHQHQQQQPTTTNNQQQTQAQKCMSKKRRKEMKIPIVADERHKVCVVDALGRSGRLDEAEEFIEREMVVAGDDCILAWKTLLSSARLFKDLPRAERIAERILSVDRRDPSVHVLLGNSYAAAGRYDDSLRVWEEMKELNIRKVPGMSSIEIDGVRHTFVVHDDTHPQREAIYSYLSSLQNRMKDAGYVPDTSVILRDMKDEKSKEEHLCSHSEKLAIAYGLLSTPPGTPLTIKQNLKALQEN